MDNEPTNKSEPLKPYVSALTKELPAAPPPANEPPAALPDNEPPVAPPDNEPPVAPPDNETGLSAACSFGSNPLGAVRSATADRRRKSARL